MLKFNAGHFARMYWIIFLEIVNVCFCTKILSLECHSQLSLLEAEFDDERKQFEPEKNAADEKINDGKRVVAIPGSPDYGAMECYHP